MFELYDFGDGNGPVPAHRHINLLIDGAPGGWVAETATVSSMVFVDTDVMIFGFALVEGSTMLRHRVKIFGHAEISGSILLCDDVEVLDYARVLGSANIGGKSRIFGHALILDNCIAEEPESAFLDERSSEEYAAIDNVPGDFSIYENPSIKKCSRLLGHARLWATRHA